VTQPTNVKEWDARAEPPAAWERLLNDFALEWQMSPAERLGMVTLLSRIQPSVAIEVGSRFGGSLQVLSRFARRVYSLDIDPSVPQRLTQFPNVQFVIGDSRQSLPELLRSLHEQRTPIQFALIDGDHSTEAVRHDAESFLQHPPLSECYVLMHDSFNPACRQGMRAVRWTQSPYVRYVELDFIQGWYHRSGIFNGQMWGGLGLAILSPEPRTGPLEVRESQVGTFESVLWSSDHNWKRNPAAFLRKLRHRKQLLSNR
jgi:hypothetical protein